MNKRVELYNELANEVGNVFTQNLLGKVKLLENLAWNDGYDDGQDDANDGYDDDDGVI